MERKVKILMVCHGNICRSPLAQSVMTYLVKERNLFERFQIESAATSREEIGNPPHPGTVRKLREEGIPLIPHRAVQMTRADYETYDYLIGMDDWNIRNMERIAGGLPLTHQDRPGWDVEALLECGFIDVTVCEPVLVKVTDPMTGKESALIRDFMVLAKKPV